MIFVGVHLFINFDNELPLVNIIFLCLFFYI